MASDHDYLIRFIRSGDFSDRVVGHRVLFEELHVEVERQSHLLASLQHAHDTIVVLGGHHDLGSELWSVLVARLNAARGVRAESWSARRFFANWLRNAGSADEECAAIATRSLLANQTLRDIVGTREYHFQGGDGAEHRLINHNKLLRTYPGAIGVKTGYTTKAGRCLVAAATRRGRTLIAVVLHSSRPYNDAARLLNLGYRTLGSGS